MLADIIELRSEINEFLQIASRVFKQVFSATIHLKKSATIQPRTSLSKFGGASSYLFNSLLRSTLRAPRHG